MDSLKFTLNWFILIEPQVRQTRHAKLLNLCFSHPLYVYQIVLVQVLDSVTTTNQPNALSSIQSIITNVTSAAYKPVNYAAAISQIRAYYLTKIRVFCSLFVRSYNVRVLPVLTNVKIAAKEKVNRSGSLSVHFFRLFMLD